MQWFFQEGLADFWQICSSAAPEKYSGPNLGMVSWLFPLVSPFQHNGLGSTDTFGCLLAHLALKIDTDCCKKEVFVKDGVWFQVFLSVCIIIILNFWYFSCPVCKSWLSSQIRRFFHHYHCRDFVKESFSDLFFTIIFPERKENSGK